MEKPDWGLLAPHLSPGLPSDHFARLAAKHTAELRSKWHEAADRASTPQSSHHHQRGGGGGGSSISSISSVAHMAERAASALETDARAGTAGSDAPTGSGRDIASAGDGGAADGGGGLVPSSSSSSRSSPTRQHSKRSPVARALELSQLGATLGLNTSASAIAALAGLQISTGDDDEAARAGTEGGAAAGERGGTSEG